MKIINYFTMIEEILETVQRMERRLCLLDRKEVREMAKFDALIQEVAENKSAIESAKLAFVALRQAIIDAQGDPAELQAIVDSLSAQTDDLANAVAENTTPV